MNIKRKKRKHRTVRGLHSVCVPIFSGTCCEQTVLEGRIRGFGAFRTLVLVFSGDREAHLTSRLVVEPILGGLTHDYRLAA